MREWKIGMLPVVDAKHQLVGIVTDRDLVVRGIAENRPLTAEAGDVMTKRLVTCRDGDELWFAEERMAAERKSRIVVVDDSRHVVGVISLSDIPMVGGRRPGRRAPPAGHPPRGRSAARKALTLGPGRAGEGRGEARPR